MRNKKNKKIAVFLGFFSLLLFGFTDFCLGSLVGDYILTEDHGLPTNTWGIYGVVENVTDFVLSLIGILAVLAFVISGIQYLTAGGDEKAAEKAKNTMKQAVLGVVVVLSAYVIILTVEYILGGFWWGS